MVVVVVEQTEPGEARLLSGRIGNIQAQAGLPLPERRVPSVQPPLPATMVAHWRTSARFARQAMPSRRQINSITALLALPWFAATGWAGSNCSPDVPSARDADVILRGGAVYTADPVMPRARAVALAEGRILAVGSVAEVQLRAGPATRIVELGGRMVLPGLHDSHAHPMSAGIWFLRCRLQAAANPDDLRRAVRACDAAQQGGEWLIARGWTDAMLGDTHPGRGFDGLETTRPTVLISAAGDRLWLGPRAFSKLGLASVASAQEGDGIERDRAGKPTGFVHGQAAATARRGIPQPTTGEYRRALQLVAAKLNARGITAVTDASVSAPMYEAYRAAEGAGELTIKVKLAHRFDNKAGTDGALRATADRGRGPMLRNDAVKIFVDGDLPGRGAALLRPYADAAATRGEPFLAPSALDRVVAALDAAHLDLHFHAMGDRAARLVLDAIERSIKSTGPRDRRHQISHLALVDRNDLPRLGQLGVIANLQLAWAAPLAYAEFEATPRLGPRRAARLLPFADLAKHGAMIVAGSDGPAPDFDPFEAIAIGATRQSVDPGIGSIGSRVLAVDKLLQAYTRNGAYSARADCSSGTLAPGFAADLVVIDRNLLEISPARIRDTQVLLTLLDGRAVYVAPGFAWPAAASSSRLEPSP